GAATALSLKQLDPALRVLMIEASAYDEWRLGETLSPGCQELLQGLGCWERFCEQGFIESFGTRAVWGAEHEYENEFLFSTHGNGWHVDRRRFDAMLCECAQDAGVEVRHSARVAGSEKTGSGFWKLAVHREGRNTDFLARFVV